MLSIWDRMLDDMQLAGFAERTQSTYLSAARRLADHVHKPPDQISEAELRQCVLYLKERQALLTHGPCHLTLNHHAFRRSDAV